MALNGNNGDSRISVDAGDPTPIESTTDIALMAFYMQNGIELVKVARQNKGSDQHVFYYRDPKDQTPDLRVRWANSSERQFDSCVRTLRKMTAEMRRSGRRRRKREKTEAHTSA